MASTKYHDGQEVTYSDDSCLICHGRDQRARHAHWLAYGHDLARHLRANEVPDDLVAGILVWLRTIRDIYGQTSARAKYAEEYFHNLAAEKQGETTL